MRLLHVIMRPRYSGAETVVRNLCHRHRRRRWEISVASLQACEPAFLPEAEALQNDGVRTFFPSQDLGRAERWRHLSQVLRQCDPDVVFAHTPVPAAYARLAAMTPPAWRPGRKLVVVLHAEDDFAIAPLRRAERVLRHATDAVVSVSDLAADLYRRRVGGHPRVFGIANGIDSEVFSLAEGRRADVRRQFGLAPGTKVILQVARLSPEKQQHLAIAALAPLLRSRRDIRLWLAGLTDRLDYEAELRRMATDLPEGSVHFLGSRDDVPQLMAAADVLVMPSKEEAQGVAVLEALAAGLPIVLADLPTLRYAATHEGVSFIHPRDAAAFLQEVRVRLASRERFTRLCADFSLDRCEARYADLAKSLIAKPTRIRVAPRLASAKS